MKNFVRMLANKEGLLKRTLVSAGVFVGMALATSLMSDDCPCEEFEEFNPESNDQNNGIIEGSAEVVETESEAS